jgi:hypothetical protein
MIKISSYVTSQLLESVSVSATVSARLLTEDVYRMAQRQNIDCSDINCMKWPLFGLSRQAVCKVLLMRSDVKELLQTPSATADVYVNAAEPSPTSFEIAFDDGSNVTIKFGRMHLVDVQPLVASGFGMPVAGEALYILEFRDDRWLRRCERYIARKSTQPYATRFETPVLKDLCSQSWDKTRIATAERNAEEPRLTALEFIMDCLNQGTSLRKQDLEKMSEDKATRLGYWLDGDATPGSFAEGNSIWEAANRFFVETNFRPRLPGSEAPWHSAPPWFIGSATHKPWQNLVDEVAARTGLTVSVEPADWGQYKYTDCVISELGYEDEERAIDFLESYKTDIIAGSIKLASRKSDTFPDISEYVVPITLSGLTRGATFGVINRHHAPADGRPPADFRPTINSHTMKPSVPGNLALSPWQKQFGAPMYSPSGYGYQLDQIPGYIVGRLDVSGELKPGDGRAQWVVGQDMVLIESDVASIGVDPARTTFGQTDRIPSMGWQYPRASASYTEGTFGNAYSIRLAQRYVASMKAGVCDIWLRGFHQPTQIWSGGTNLELRLQTDDKGFGYPTTRIHGSYDDPLISPQESDGEETVVGSGLARTYKGEDGKTRVNVEWPYGIPCLVRIVNNQRMEAGVDRWRYLVEVVHVAYPKATSDRPLVCSNDVNFQGNQAENLFRPNCESVNGIFAYNIAENDNTATFSAPSYKKPSPFPNFRVLPIGENRDGQLETVCVQAMIYWSGFSHSPIFNLSTSEPNPRNRNFADVPQIFFCLANAVDGTC